MRRSVTLALLALIGCTTGPARHALSVREVVENATALDGQVVVVTGWLERCHRFSCGLHGSASEVRKDFPYYLSIGRSDWFDAFARRAAPTRVTLRARVHDRCISNPADGTISACADRSGTLEPLAVIR